MIEEQREKEFLFELEQICRKYSIVFWSHCYRIQGTEERPKSSADGQIKNMIQDLETERDEEPIRKDEIKFKGVPIVFNDCLYKEQPPKAEPVMIEAWLYHPDILSRIGEYCLFGGVLQVITPDGLEPYYK